MRERERGGEKQTTCLSQTLLLFFHIFHLGIAIRGTPIISIDTCKNRAYQNLKRRPSITTVKTEHCASKASW